VKRLLTFLVSLLCRDGISNVQTFEESGAKSPAQGVEAAMRLLFGGAEEGVVLEESGKFYAMSKDQTDLLHSCIAVQPSST